MQASHTVYQKPISVFPRVCILIMYTVHVSCKSLPTHFENNASIFCNYELTCFCCPIKLSKVQPSLQLSQVTEDWERGQDQEDHH